MRRVLHLLTAVEVGGAEYMVLRLVSALRDRGVDAGVLCLRDTGALYPAFQRAEVPVVVLPDAQQTSALGLVMRLAFVLRRAPPDIIHSHTPSALLVGGIAGSIARVPAHIHTKHGAGGFTTPAANLARRWAIRSVDKFVSVSGHTAADAAALDGVPARKLVTIHNGVDLLPPRAPRARTAAPTLLTVGRLEPIKGHDVLLHAMVIVLASQPGTRLRIAGDGSQRGALESLAKELRIDHAVEFLGMQDDVQPWLRDADVFVLPSRSEGISLTLLEAMAAGLPVVATDVGGTPEVVRADIDGVLVPSEQPAAMASAIAALMRDDSRRNTLSHAGYQRVASAFTFNHMVQRYMRLYDEVAAGSA